MSGVRRVMPPTLTSEAIALKNYIANNTVKVIAVLLALVIYFILSGVYSLLRLVIVC